MTYNILAKKNTPDSYYDYEGAPSEADLQFETRGPRIVNEIQESGATIVGLQEVDMVKEYYASKFLNGGFTLMEHYPKG